MSEEQDRDLEDEPLLTITPDDEGVEGGYWIFSRRGDREVFFGADGLLELAAWIEGHRTQLEQEAKRFVREQ